MQCFYKRVMSFNLIVHDFSPRDRRIPADGQFHEIGPMVYKSLTKQSAMTQLNGQSSISSIPI
jgi:hypothetical protein